MAVQMLKRGATPAIVGKALGHASPDTTSVYVELARDLVVTRADAAAEEEKAMILSVKG